MTPTRYSRAAIVLHWAIALALAFQLALGWRMETIPTGVAQFTAFQLHKSVGITILLLSLARLAIRLMRARPAPLPDTRPNHALASIVHAGFYLVMIGAPLTGWALVSTAKIKLPTLLFGVLPWPHLPLAEHVQGISALGHEWLAWAALGLFALHVAGALRHQLILKEALLERMIPAAKAGLGTAALALIAVSGAHSVGWQWPFSGTPTPQSSSATPPAASLTNPDDPKSAEEAIEDTANASAAADNAMSDEPANAIASAPIKLPLSKWAVQPGGRLGFTANWNGSAVPGSFGGWTGDITFSPDDLKESRISVTVDLASVSTAEAQYAESLKSADFFNVATHPRATFAATRITHTGGDRYAANGTLSLHGVSRPVTLAFTLVIKGDLASVKGSTRLDRTAFRVGSGEWAATDQIAGGVEVDFSFKAKRE